MWNKLRRWGWMLGLGLPLFGSRELLTRTQAHSSNLVGSGYLLCLNYTARKSSRSSCAGEGVVIDHVLPGDFEIRLMVIVREGRNANEIVVIAADVMQNIKAQSWPKKHFRLNFVSRFSSV